MSERLVQAVLVVYPDSSNADAAVDELRRMEESGRVQIDGLATVSKHLDGAVTGEVVGASSGARSAARGGLIGAAVGLTFPPIMVGATIVGASIGGFAEHRRRRSEHREVLRALGERLPPGFSGVIVLADDVAAYEIAGLLTGYTDLHRVSVDAETLVVQPDERRGTESV